MRLCLVGCLCFGQLLLASDFHSAMDGSRDCHCRCHLPGSIWADNSGSPVRGQVAAPTANTDPLLRRPLLRRPLLRQPLLRPTLLRRGIRMVRKRIDEPVRPSHAIYLPPCLPRQRVRQAEGTQLAERTDANDQRQVNAPTLNPYETPATPAPEPTPGTSLLRPARPEIATALWFVGLFAVHIGLVSIPAHLLGESSLDFSPFLWLTFATGLYFRLGPVRRFTLLVGIFAIATATGGALAVLLSLAMDSADSEAGSSFRSQLLSCLALFAASAYPVIVLWPGHVRDRFRDRLPARTPR